MVGRMDFSRRYREHTGWIYTVSWVDNQRLVSAGQDRTIHVWDINNLQQTLHTFTEHKKGRVNSVACSPDGQYIASASEDKTVRIFRAHFSGEISPPKEDHQRHVNCVAWSPNGDLLLATGGDDAIVRVWRLTPYGNELNCFPGPIFQNHYQTQRLKRWINGTGIQALAWSPDGQLIASAGDDKIVRLWKSDSGEAIEPYYYKGHTRRVNALAWSPDGQLIASAGDDQCVHIWEAATGILVKLIKPDDPQPNFVRRAIATARRRRGQPSARPPVVFGIVTALAWSPSQADQKLAFASRKVVHIFERNQKGIEWVNTYRQHKDWVRTVAWSPDGTWIASAGDDRQVHVWRNIAPPRTPDPI